jgi:hypothetical protein
MFNHGELGGTFGAKVLLSRLHGSVTGGNGHGTYLSTRPASLAVLRSLIERQGDMPVFAPAYHAQGTGLPDLAAHTYTTAAQHTRCVVEGVAYLGHPTSHCQVLDGPRVGRLRHQQLGNVAPQAEDLFRVGADDHPFFGLEGAGSRDPGSSVFQQFHQAHTTTSNRQDTPHVAEVGDADAMIEGRIQDTNALWHPDPGPVDG